MLKRISYAAIILAISIPRTSVAGDLELSPALTTGEFHRLCEELAGAVWATSPSPRKLGLTGIQLDLRLALIPVDENEGWWRHGVEGASRVVGSLPAFGIGLRKGLGAGFSAGGAVGFLAGESFYQLGLEWHGEGPSGFGNASLSLYGSKLDAGSMDLTTVSLEARLSKKLALITPYVGTGIIVGNGEGKWGDPEVVKHSHSFAKPAVEAGLELGGLLSGFRIAVGYSSSWSSFIAFSLGL